MSIQSAPMFGVAYRKPQVNSSPEPASQPLFAAQSQHCADEVQFSGDVSRRNLLKGLAAGAAATAAIGCGPAVPAAAHGNTHSSTSAARQTSSQFMKKRPTTPTNQNIFSSAVYTKSKAMKPVTFTKYLTESEAKAKLIAYKNEEGSALKLKKALAFFNSSVAKKKIQTPALRAMYAAAAGDFDKTLAYLLSNKIKSVAYAAPNDPNFAQLPNGNYPIAHTFKNNDGTYTIKFSDRVKGDLEDKNNPSAPFIETPGALHEEAHAFDNSFPDAEEVILLVNQTAYELKQKATHPRTMRQKGTPGELARRLNTNELAMLNSGHNGQVNITNSNKGKDGKPQAILPGSALKNTSFESVLPAASGSSPGNLVLNEQLSKFGIGSSNFSQATLNKMVAAMDNGKGPVTPTYAQKAANALAVV